MPQRALRLTVTRSLYALLVALASVLCISAVSFADDIPPDTTIDTTFVPPPARTDTGKAIHAIDTLKGTPVTPKAPGYAVKPQSSADDTADVWFPFRFQNFAVASLFDPRYSERHYLDDAFYHEAGDYFRNDRSFFTLAYYQTPFRHTVAPYGLNGDRVSSVFNGQDLQFDEHFMEQDGLQDFNDLPTAPVGDFHFLHGPTSAFLGGRSGIGGIYLEPVKSDTGVTESRLEAQKGTFGYAYTKGIITETSNSGFSYTAALGYRKTNYEGVFRDDNAYHQYWKFEAPIFKKLRSSSTLRLYRRDNDYLYRPAALAQNFNRHRRDQEFRSSLEYLSDEDHTLGLSFAHENHVSRTEDAPTYKTELRGNINQIAVWYSIRSGETALEFKGDAAQNKFKINSAENTRNSGEFSIRILNGAADSLTGSTGTKTFAEVSAVGVGGLSVLPKASAGIVFRGKKRELSITVGATPKFPSQYALDLPFENPITAGGFDMISQTGNPLLQPERQYTTALSLRLGTPRSHIQVDATGGYVHDGITWRHLQTGPDSRLYRPINEHFTYESIGLRAQLMPAHWLTWYGSGAFFDRHYYITEAPAYSPNYNLMSGLSVKLYIEKLDLHLSGYSDITYTDEYLGYNGDILGAEPLLNARLSFRIKRFNFHYIFEDALDADFFEYEEYYNFGRYNWYWITWDFTD